MGTSVVITSWSEATVGASGTAAEVAPIANQKFIRLIPLKRGNFYLGFNSGVNTNDYEKFGASSPVTILTSAPVYIIGSVAGTTVTTSTSYGLVNEATDTINYTAHGLSNDNLVVYTTSGTVIGGLTASNSYYVVNAATNTFQLSTSQGGAAVNLTGDGSGNHTFTMTQTIATSAGLVTEATNVINFNAHGFTDGNQIVYTSTGVIGGLTSTNTYYVISATTNSFKLSSTLNGAEIDLTDDGSADQTFTRTNTIATTSGLVNQTTDSINITSHGFSDNTAITYTTSNTAIGGLTSGSTYYVVSSSANAFKLSLSIGGTAVDLTNNGVGTHTFNPNHDVLVEQGV